MDSSPVVVPMGRSPEFIGASLRFWKRVILGGGAVAALGLAGGIVHSAHRAGSDGPLGIGMIAAGFLLPMVYGFWWLVRTGLRKSGKGPGGVFEAVLDDHSVAFRRRNGSESTVEYKDIDCVFTLYADGNKNYDTLELCLYDIYGGRHGISDLESDGDRVEALAEAIRERVRAMRGACHGDREQDRSLRRKQRDTVPLGRMGLVIAWLVSLVFLFALIMVEREVWRESEVLSSGITATGLTTAIHFDKGNCLVEYEFRDTTEMRYTGRGRLRRDDDNPLLVHGPIDVVYLRESPERNLPAGHFIEAGPAVRMFAWLMAAFFLSGSILVSGGLDIAFIRGRVALLRRHELEEEWWERNGKC